MRDRAARDRRAYWMQLIFEARGYPEVAASTPDSSEQIRLLIPAGPNYLAFSADEIPPNRQLKRAADLQKHVLVHSYWSPSDVEPPTWQRWIAVARRKWRSLPDFKDLQHLSFREELHAIEAVIAGQGIGIFGNVLVASELASGKLVKAFDLSLPGYDFYVVRRHGHPREKIIRVFSTWLRSVR